MALPKVEQRKVQLPPLEADPERAPTNAKETKAAAAPSKPVGAFTRDEIEKKTIPPLTESDLSAQDLAKAQVASVQAMLAKGKSINQFAAARQKAREEMTAAGAKACNLTTTDKAQIQCTVKELQIELNRGGFNVGTEDGMFGKNTKAGFEAFKETLGIDESKWPKDKDIVALARTYANEHAKQPKPIDLGDIDEPTMTSKPFDSEVGFAPVVRRPAAESKGNVITVDTVVIGDEPIGNADGPRTELHAFVHGTVAQLLGKLDAQHNKTFNARSDERKVFVANNGAQVLAELDEHIKRLADAPNKDQAAVDELAFCQSQRQRLFDYSA